MIRLLQKENEKKKQTNKLDALRPFTWTSYRDILSKIIEHTKNK